MLMPVAHSFSHVDPHRNMTVLIGKIGTYLDAATDVAASVHRYDDVVVPFGHVLETEFSVVPKPGIFDLCPVHGMKSRNAAPVARRRDNLAINLVGTCREEQKERE